VAAASFLDTNLLIYAVDRGHPAKRSNAISLIAHHASRRSGVISTQVLQKFYSAATRKLGIAPAAAKNHLQDFQIFPVVQISPLILEQGIDLSVLHQLSFWDGLIIAAAATAHATELLSEDLTHGQSIEGITVRNSFV